MLGSSFFELIHQILGSEEKQFSKDLTSAAPEVIGLEFIRVIMEFCFQEGNIQASGWLLFYVVAWDADSAWSFGYSSARRVRAAWGGQLRPWPCELERCAEDRRGEKAD